MAAIATSIGFGAAYIHPKTSGVLLSSCNIQSEERIVRGDSLTGFLEQGIRVRLLFGYYDCHSVERGDIVAYQYASRKTPLVKIVRGVPGDTFVLQKSDYGFWRLLINGEVAKTSKGEPYSFNEAQHTILSPYEHDYRGVIPDGAYFIFGNVPEGSLDSSRFGLAGKRDIIAKVIVEK